MNALNIFINRKKFSNNNYFYVANLGSKLNQKNFSNNLTRLVKARKYMINDIISIDKKKNENEVEYNYGHGNPANVNMLMDTKKEINKLLTTKELSKYNSALGSKKENLLKFLHSQNIYYDNYKEITVNNIVPTNSVTNAFDLVLKTICREHDVVLFTAPCYGLFTYMPERVGATTKFIKLRKEDNYLINPELLKLEIIKINKNLAKKYINLDYTPRVVAFVNENPHNPIGSVISSDKVNLIKELNKVCYETSTFIIDDLVYQGTEYNQDKKALPLAVFPKYFSNVISLFGVSKAFSIPGVRVGFIVANDKLIYEIRNHIFYSMDSYSLLNEVILSSIFNKDTYQRKEQQKLLNHNIDLYIKNMNIINKFIASKKNKVKKIECLNLESGFFYILDFTEYKNTKYKNYKIKSEKDLLCFLYEYGNIRFVTGEAIAWPDKSMLIGRITFSDSTEKLIKFLKVLNDTLSLLR